jgi:hypothetical protein
MKVEHPNAPKPSPEDIRALEQLKITIERAIADGKLSRQEIDRIKANMSADGKVTFDELELYRTLVQEKINQGQLEYDW